MFFMILFSMIFLSLTLYGWSGVLALLFGLWLTYKIGQRRLHAGKGGLGCLGFGYVFLVVTIVMVFAISITIGMGSSLYKTTQLVVNGQRYEAKVISYSSYESHDADAGTTTTMFTPTVEFTTLSGVLVAHTLSYSSSSQPTIEATVTVYYDETSKDSVSFGFGTFALFFGTLLMMVVLVFALWGILLYAMNYKMEYYLNVIKYIGLTFFIPIVMVLFDGLLIYALFYGNEVPLFVSGILVFFILMLTLGIWGYIKMIRTHDMVWKKTGPTSWAANPVPKKTKKEKASTWIKRN
ncbi:hypothetical protein M2306_000454 [Myroides gitamensis]|nr:hypothetical protein [Myroides gitamensis]